MTDKDFRLTYATMYDPPEELHTRFEEALEDIRSRLGQEHGMIIDGQEVKAGETFEDYSPIDTSILLGTFQKGDASHAQQALTAARKAFRSWAATPWQKRVDLLRKAAANIDARLFEIAAVITLEVGKNRMEALGDIAEAADLIRYACDQMEANDGYRVVMGKDPLKGYDATNISVLKPYGVWVVISPFNFPAAMTGGPPSNPWPGVRA